MSKIEVNLECETFSNGTNCRLKVLAGLSI
jgi:hypothetical protein